MPAITLRLTGLPPVLSPCLLSLSRTCLLLPALRVLSLLAALGVSRLLALLLAVRVPVASRGALIQTATQRIKVIRELSGSIQSFFRSGSSRAACALLRGLQAFGEIVQTSLD